MSDWNAPIIEEFRDNRGVVGGIFEGKPLLLLHHKGAKSGAERISPLMYQVVGGAYAIFASKAGADTHPAWYHNLIANPITSVEVGTERVDVKARVADPVEREEIWERQKANFAQFAGYEAKTDRVIPVVILDPVG